MNPWPLAAISVYFLLAVYSMRLRRQAWKRLEADAQEFARTRALLSQLDRQALVPIAISHATAAFPSFAIRRLRAKVPDIPYSEARNILLLMNYGPLDPPSSTA